MNMNKGKVIIISAPSGTGKSTIIKHIENLPELNLQFSISATTRKPRSGEVDGIDYYYFDRDQFLDAIKNNLLVEYQEVYNGTLYGTLKSEVERIRKSGKNIILDIDVKGALNVKRLYPHESLALFIKPPSLEVLKERLISRNTDSIESINQRIAKAEEELNYANQFDDCVVNDDLEKAVTDTYNAIKNFIES